MTNEHERRLPEQQLHEQLCAYVLGECTSEERLEIERELMRSPELRAQRDTIERTVGLVRVALGQGESLSPEAAETVISAASASSKPSTWQAVPWLRIAAGLSAVALGVAIVRRSADRIEPEVALLDSAKRPGYGAREASGNEMRGFATPTERADDESARSGRRDKDGAGAKRQLSTADLSAQEPQFQPRGDPVDLVAATPLPVAPDKEHKRDLDDLKKVQDLASSSGAVVDVPSVKTKEVAPGREGLALGSTDGASKDKKDKNTAVSAGGGSYRGPGDSARPGGVDRDNGPAAPSSPAAGALVINTPAGIDSFDALRAAGAPPSTEKAGEDQIVGLLPRETKTRGAPPGAAASAPASKPGLTGPSGGVAPSSTPVGGARPAKLGDAGMSADRGELAKLSEADVAGRVIVPAESTAQDLGFLVTESFEAEEPVLYYKLPVVDQQVYLDRECRRILSGCVRQPNERPRDMYFRFWGDNPFEVSALDPLSTFSADVDTASYTLARRFLNEGHVPEKAQIRTEEFVNYFKSDVPAPTTGVFAIQTNLAPSRFSTDTTRQMLRVVLRGKDLSKLERKPMNLTFVVDVSGSMREQNRLEMVKHAIRLLVTQLDQYDKIGIVKFSSDASMVLPMTSVTDRARIESAIQPLIPDGGTNSNAGLELGYGVALNGLDPNATNRVVFLSDGVANVGETDPAKIAERVKPMREKGIYLNTIGVGMNNHNDVLLEQLADKADGMCNYIDTPAEAKRALVDNFTGAFQPIARDVKIQVEFDPTQVLRYRLLGYENRAIADADFRNDKVDAGELGAGHQVTALYEIERQASLASEQMIASNVIPPMGRPLATVRVRWKDPRNFGTNAEQDTATEITHTVAAGQVSTFEGAGQSYRKVVLAAQFGEILRRSIHARGDSIDDLLNESLKLQKEIPADADFNEFVLLVSKSKDLILRTMPACDDLCQAIDSVREYHYRRAQLEQLQRETDQKTLEDLKRQNDELEARLRDLVRRRLETQGR